MHAQPALGEFESTSWPKGGGSPTIHEWVDGWMDKQNVLYTYSGILFSLKKEGDLANCDNMDGPRRHYVKWNRPDRKTKTVCSHLYMNLK